MCFSQNPVPPVFGLRGRALNFNFTATAPATPKRGTTTLEPSPSASIIWNTSLKIFKERRSAFWIRGQRVGVIRSQDQVVFWGILRHFGVQSAVAGARMREKNNQKKGNEIAKLGPRTVSRPCHRSKRGQRLVRQPPFFRLLPRFPGPTVSGTSVTAEGRK